jgi:hypothetical protein
VAWESSVLHFKRADPSLHCCCSGIHRCPTTSSGPRGFLPPSSSHRCAYRRTMDNIHTSFRVNWRSPSKHLGSTSFPSQSLNSDHLSRHGFSLFNSINSLLVIFLCLSFRVKGQFLTVSLRNHLSSFHWRECSSLELDRPPFSVQNPAVYMLGSGVSMVVERRDIGPITLGAVTVESLRTV